MLQFSGCRSLPNQPPSLAATFSITRASQLELVHMLSSSVRAQDRPNLATSYYLFFSLPTNKPVLKHFQCSLFPHNFFCHVEAEKTNPNLILNLLQTQNLQIKKMNQFNSKFQYKLFLSLHILDASKRLNPSKLSPAPKQSEFHLVSFQVHKVQIFKKILIH